MKERWCLDARRCVRNDAFNLDEILEFGMKFCSKKKTIKRQKIPLLARLRLLGTHMAEKKLPIEPRYPIVFRKKAAVCALHSLQ